MSILQSILGRRFFFFSISLCWIAVLALPVSVQASESNVSVQALLGKMSKSLRETSYSGVFTFEHGGMLDAMRLVHRVQGGVEREHLEYLNGPLRVIERTGMDDSCLTVSERMIRQDVRDDDAQLFSSGGLSQYYHMYLNGEQRVAGRNAVVIHIMARDEYRYGYTIFVDSETSLPLLTMTIDKRRKVLERMQFSDLNIGQQATEQFVVTQQERVEPVACSVLGESPTHWQPDWIPDGFELSGFKVHETKGEALSFTDGLAAFTVFVQDDDLSLSYKGTAQRGASAVVMNRMNLNGQFHIVSVVGEIPIAAAERVIRSVSTETQ